MSIPPLPDRRTPEERAAAHQKWIDDHYLVEGRAYTYEANCCWWSGWFPSRRNYYAVHIKQAECPWMIVATELYPYPTIVPGAKIVQWLRAHWWAKRYLRRGGPPANFFAPPPPSPDPRMVVYKKKRPKGAGIVGPDWP